MKPTNNKLAHFLSQMLTSKDWRSKSVDARVETARRMGYMVERVRHQGSHVGQIYKLKSGEIRVAIDSPRGLYRTAWSIIIGRNPNPKFAN